MFTFQSMNAHQMLPKILASLRSVGMYEESRNGEVLRFAVPVAMEFVNPQQRVIFWPERDANPYFHFMECLWMIVGWNDVRTVAHYNSNMEAFSDDGFILNGAYGQRWRSWFEKDQITEVIHNLKQDPSCRRQVIGMWDPRWDLSNSSKDVPCNTHIYFSISEERLNMMVCNRSNDIIWGALGANVVHFSFLQEFIANALDIPVGRYWHISNNMHIYPERHIELLFKMSEINRPVRDLDPYVTKEVEPVNRVLHRNPETFTKEAEMLLVEGPVVGITEPYLRQCAVPIMQSWEAWKEGEIDQAIEIVGTCAGIDWRKACIEWLERRKARRITHR